MSLIIDCHGHYTVLPKGHDAWREAQKAAFKEGTAPPPYPDISDDEIRAFLEGYTVGEIPDYQAAALAMAALAAA